jgi:(2Fe-2S) ferredoxin
VPERIRLAVCKGPNCTYNGADAVAEALRTAVVRLGLAESCEIARGGCYGLCAFGPNLILRPFDPTAPRDPLDTGDFMLLGTTGERHYSAMTPDKAERLVESEVRRREAIPEWLHKNRARRP